MARVAKIAISIPADTLKGLERARARLRKTRSAAVTEAIDEWLRGGEVDREDERYVRGYLKHPEHDDATAVAAAVVETWEPWE